MGRNTYETVKSDILPVLPVKISRCLEAINESCWERVHEIRLRAGKYPTLSMSEGEYELKELISRVTDINALSQEDISNTIGIMSQNSIYAVQEEIKAGFLTLKGGHRVGMTGKVICDSNSVKGLKYFSGLNVRISRQIFKSADFLLNHVIKNGEFINTLIVSPPGCGKTTILRDLIRQLSSGVSQLGVRGKTVGLVDERSEIAACYKGIAQNDVGPRTDVLDNCPKAEGILMLVRSMGPAIVATDEIGSMEDSTALMTALFAGIGVAATAHGSCLKDVLFRPGLNKLIKMRAFERIVFLNNCLAPGTVGEIYDGFELKKIYVRDADGNINSDEAFGKRLLMTNKLRGAAAL